MVPEAGDGALREDPTAPGAARTASGPVLARKGATMSVPGTMKAAVLLAPHRFEVQDRPVPRPGPEDVLVRVRACGV